MAKKAVVEEVKDGAIEVAVDGVPSFILRADSAFHIRCMMMVRELAVFVNHPEKAEISKTLREFDLYEEQHREVV